MTIYEPGIESDLLLLRWYGHMGEIGDLEKVFSVTMAPCSAFMSEMRKCFVVYEADADGIWFAAWFDPAMAGAYHHAWIRHDHRKSRAGLLAMIESLYLGLERWPVLISVTKQPEVPTQIQRLGFVTLGTVPWLFDGEEATISYLDTAHFYPAMKKYERALAIEEPTNGRQG